MEGKHPRSITRCIRICLCRFWNKPFLAQFVLQHHAIKHQADYGRAIKTLGVWWLASEDIYTFRKHVPDSNMLYTKRNFLKKIAKLFDPIGFLAPFTIRAKMFLQDMWTAGLEWDDELTEPLASCACAWFNELEKLAKVRIPRCLHEKTDP